MKAYQVLVVDDDETIHRLLEEYLGLSGFTVLHSTDGQQGIEMMEAVKPAVVLLDINMPVMDGFEAMQRIRRHRELNDIPVLFLTCLDRSNLKVKALELGADDYIVKPFNLAELLARVRAAIRRSARYKSNESQVTGDLAHMGLAELLQTMELGKKTATIHLQDMDGRICIEDGWLVGVEQGEGFRGREALQRLFVLERGRFSVAFGELPRDLQKHRVSIQSGLMEVVAFLDELNLMLSSMAEGDPVVAVEPGAPEDLASFRKHSPLRLSSLAVRMPGDLKGNVSRLIEAHNQGYLKIIG